MAEKAKEKAEKKTREKGEKASHKNVQEKEKKAEKAKGKKEETAEPLHVKADAVKEKKKEHAVEQEKHVKEERKGEKPGKMEEKKDLQEEQFNEIGAEDNRERKKYGKEAEEEYRENKKHEKRGEKKPARKWIELKPAEIEEAAISLANAGHTASEIGMILRDQYGVPKVKIAARKTVTEILREHKLLAEIPEDLFNLIRKSVRLKEHLQKNRKDTSAKRGYQLTVSKIRRLVNYYTGTNRLPKAWRFSEEQAELLVK